jgi:hypothetical protein
MCSMSALDRRGASNRLGADVVHWQRGRWLDQQYRGDMVLLLFLARTINNTHPFVAGRFVAALSQRANGSLLSSTLLVCPVFMSATNDVILHFAGVPCIYFSYERSVAGLVARNRIPWFASVGITNKPLLLATF